MRRAYDKCRASNCTAATVGCLQAHMSELGSDCAAAVEEMAGCCPEPAVAHRCPGAESRALAACANDTAALQAAWPQECWTLNCTATAVGCLLAHKSELRLTCQGAVSEVQQCCARPEEESKCSAQEEEVLMVCQDDMRALQTLLPQAPLPTPRHAAPRCGSSCSLLVFRRALLTLQPHRRSAGTPTARSTRSTACARTGIIWRSPNASTPSLPSTRV